MGVFKSWMQAKRMDGLYFYFIEMPENSDAPTAVLPDSGCARLGGSSLTSPATAVGRCWRCEGCADAPITHQEGPTPDKARTCSRQRGQIAVSLLRHAACATMRVAIQPAIPLIGDHSKLPPRCGLRLEIH